MSSKVCPFTSLPTGVRIVAYGDAICSIMLFIFVFLTVVGLLFVSDKDLDFPIELGVGKRIALLFVQFLLVVLGVAQLWTARVLYKYTESSNQTNQNDRGFWQWLLVTTVTIVWFIQMCVGTVLVSDAGFALLLLIIIVFKIYGVVVVADFKKSLKIQETGALSGVP